MPDPVQQMSPNRIVLRENDRHSQVTSGKGQTIKVLKRKIFG